MAEFKDLVAASEDYAEAQKQLNSQIEEMKANLASIGISVDSIKTTELMSYFSDDNYNHSIEPVPFKITYYDGNELNAVSSLPLTADLVDEGLKFRNPKNPSEILTGTYKPYAATAIHTFELKDMNQSEASFSFNYPELIGLSDKTVYPKEIVFIGPDGQFMLYRNSNFSDYAMKYGTDNSKITNFVVKKKRYWWDGTSYMSGWCSQQGESLSYYDHSTKRMTLLFPDEVFCMEMLDTEWAVYTCFDYTAPTGTNEPKAAPTYKFSGAALTVSGMKPASYYRDLQIVDEKVRAIKTDGKIIAISDNLSNISFTTYGTDKMNIVTDWSSLSLNDTFYLGKYQVGSETPWDIEWEIVHQESNYQIAMAKQILDLRCFDAMGPSNSDSGRKNYGNHNWQYSNIEQWLNSDASAGNWYSAQHSADAPPSSANVWVNNNVAYNPYDTKPGFLYYWSDEEKAVLQDMTLTLANNKVTDGGGSYTWTGKIWLPTYTQLSGKQNNSISEGTQFSKFTDDASRIKTIHAMCAANNQYCIDNGYTEGTAWYYWMSSASPSYSSTSRPVNDGGLPDSNYGAYLGYIGLAPCIRIPR